MAAIDIKLFCGWKSEHNIHKPLDPLNVNTLMILQHKSVRSNLTMTS